MLQTIYMSANDPTETLSHKLAEVLNENDALRVACRGLAQQLEAAEEIIMRLQSKNLSWEPPTETAHHLDHH